MSTTISTTTSSDSSTACDQWQQWAQKQRKNHRQESENLIYGHEGCNHQVQEFMELPRKRRVSLLDDSGDCDQEQKVASWTMLPKRKSLLDDDDSDDDDDTNDDNQLEPLTPLTLLSADDDFVPPTCLRRSDSRTGRLLAMASMRALKGSDTNLVSPLAMGKSLSFDSAAMVPPPPLSILSAFSAPRPRYSFSRDSPLV